MPSGVVALYVGPDFGMILGADHWAAPCLVHSAFAAALLFTRDSTLGLPAGAWCVWGVLILAFLLVAFMVLAF